MFGHATSYLGAVFLLLFVYVCMDVCVNVVVGWPARVHLCIWVPDYHIRGDGFYRDLS